MSDQAENTTETGGQVHPMVSDGPPFDGKPCPMCPGDLRNLAATSHNLAGCLGDNPDYCRIPKKLTSLRMAVEHGALNTDHPAILDLIACARKVAAISNYPELFALKDELKAALIPVQELSDIHFSDRRHSHGDYR